AAKTDSRYEQIAKIPGTKVVLMGTDRLEDWTKSLIAHGMSPDTPVAMVRWGTMGRQKSVGGTLATIAALAAKEKISPPVLTIIGDVVKLGGKLNWFEHRLAELGADVLESPTIKITGPTDRSVIVDALLELNSYDWLVFTSANGVAAFFDLFFK